MFDPLKSFHFSTLAPGMGFEPMRPKGSSDLKSSRYVPLDDVALEAFKQFCEIDLQLQPRTIKGHVRQVGRFLRAINKSPQEVTDGDIRSYLVGFKQKAPDTYRNVLWSLRVFFRDFIKRGEVVKGFRLPRSPIKPKTVPTREQVQKFYVALKSPMERAIFLMYATSGLRKHELQSLTLQDIDIENRMILPKKRWQ
jgi:site-specific recombinase XerC